MKKLSMEIRTQLQQNYNLYRPQILYENVYFSGNRVPKCVEKSIDKFKKRPVAGVNATGFLSHKVKKITVPISRYFREYKKNIKHTYDHKIVFAIIEKKLFKKNSTDAITHDLDKLILYTLGFPKSFVTRFHRAHSTHHIESKLKPNQRTILIDNIASSPQFKPEKKLSLRDYFYKSSDMQSIDGLEALFKKYNFGENLDFESIKNEQKNKSTVPHIAKRLLNIVFNTL